MTAPQTITAIFRDGPLAGTSVEVDLEKHDWHDRKTGARYVRLTEYTAGNVVSYFVLRETAYRKGRFKHHELHSLENIQL